MAIMAILVIEFSSWGYKSKESPKRSLSDFTKNGFSGYTVRNYLHGLQNSGESIEDSDLHTDFGPITW